MLHQRLAPQHSEITADAWQAAMGRGDFESAWRVSDRVLAARNRTASNDPGLPYHQRWIWDGRCFDNKRVIVRCYHGLGDTLQFCRFLAPLRRRARFVTLELQSELLDALAQLDGPDELVPFQPAQPLAPSDCDIEIMELCHALRRAPTPEPYLRAANHRVHAGLRVGLCWQGSSTWLPERSIPADLFAPLLALPNVEFVSLGRGSPVPPGLRDDCPSTILDTARRIGSLDLVISMDTMVAHLAGALGVPLWLLLKHEPDWRWLAGGAGSVWYPRVRKFQQSRAGCWGEPIGRLVACLQDGITRGTLRI